jgi:sugar lactone lactonase YvrE
MNQKLLSFCSDRNVLTNALAGACCLAAISFPAAGLTAEQLFVSKRIAPIGEYPSGIEGPAVDASGDLYVVNFKQKGMIGRLKAGATKSEPFAPLESGSAGNGIRFDLQRRMYVADYKKNKIHVFESGSTTRQDYFAPQTPLGKPAFNQPNDLAIARDGTLYASDPKSGAGRIWKITRDAGGNVTGKIMTSSSSRQQGQTNGLDLSPDNKTLYVSESRVNNPDGTLKAKAAVYAYRIDGDNLADENRLALFDKKDVDGLRVDTDGRIFVARPDAGVVAVVVPPGSMGTPQPDIPVMGSGPTNLTFGGADGRDVYVTQSIGGFIVRFRTDRPGREPCLLTPPPADCRPVAQ